jgi:hypothetical protein
MRKAVLLFLFIYAGHIVYAQEEPERRAFSIIPMASYDYVHLDEQAIHSPSLGIAVTAGDYGNDFTDIHRSFFGVAKYQPVFFKQNAGKGTFHQIDLMLDGRIERHQLLAMFQSDSDKPAVGGLHTFQAGAGWGYEVIHNSSVSLILGAALAAGDFGIELPNGEPLPVTLLPIVRFNFTSKWFDGAFEFLTGPELSFTIAPEKRIRFSGEIEIDGFESINDVTGEGILWYRFFPESSGVAPSSLGDFLGIGLGIRNDSFGFDLTGSNKDTFESQYTSIFATVDATALQISAGYIFDSRELYNDTMIRNTGQVFFISVQAMYRF